MGWLPTCGSQRIRIDEIYYALISISRLSRVAPLNTQARSRELNLSPNAGPHSSCAGAVSHLHFQRSIVGLDAGPVSRWVLTGWKTVMIRRTLPRQRALRPEVGSTPTLNSFLSLPRSTEAALKSWVRIPWGRTHFWGARRAGTTDYPARKLVGQGPDLINRHPPTPSHPDFFPARGFPFETSRTLFRGFRTFPPSGRAVGQQDSIDER